MFITILGRQPAISMAELECRYGAPRTAWLHDDIASVDAETLDVTTLGGTQKAGRIIAEYPHQHWPRIHRALMQHYQTTWDTTDHKRTLGISAYHLDLHARDLLSLGLDLKKQLRKHGGTLRLVPSHDLSLNTAVSHHNKLGLSPHKIELLIIGTKRGRTIVAESVGAQNITALASRDQARPKTDAFVGMLPPKLALTMINLSGITAQATEPADQTILDPFCGTGVILQEGMLLGYHVIGTDLSEKMRDYSRTNIEWLTHKYPWINTRADISLGDATTATWPPHITAVVSETYLGQPFSAPPAAEKLTAVRDNCNHIISTFLTNLAPQISSGTRLCLAVPAWRAHDESVTHLPLINSLEQLGYMHVSLSHVRPDQLLYYRPQQVVARQLLLLEKA